MLQVGSHESRNEGKHSVPEIMESTLINMEENWYINIIKFKDDLIIKLSFSLQASTIITCHMHHIYQLAYFTSLFKIFVSLGMT
jgi:hypothetical protein